MKPTLLWVEVSLNQMFQLCFLHFLFLILGQRNFLLSVEEILHRSLIS